MFQIAQESADLVYGVAASEGARDATVAVSGEVTGRRITRDASGALELLGL